jgi:hypothetical protein
MQKRIENDQLKADIIQLQNTCDFYKDMYSRTMQENEQLKAETVKRENERKEADVQMQKRLLDLCEKQQKTQEALVGILKNAPEFRKRDDNIHGETRLKSLHIPEGVEEDFLPPFMIDFECDGIEPHPCKHKLLILHNRITTMDAAQIAALYRKHSLPVPPHFLEHEKKTINVVESKTSFFGPIAEQLRLFQSERHPQPFDSFSLRHDEEGIWVGLGFCQHDNPQQPVSAQLEEELRNVIRPVFDGTVKFETNSVTCKHS